MAVTVRKLGTSRQKEAWATILQGKLQVLLFGDKGPIIYSYSHESEWRMILTALVLYVILRVK